MLRHDLPGGCSLRLLEESDADELFAVIDANRDHLGRWMPWVEGERKPEDVLPFIRATRKQIADNDGLQTTIVDAAGRIVGWSASMPSTGPIARRASGTGWPAISRDAER